MPPENDPSSLVVSSTSLSSDQPRSRRVASAPDGAATERQLARWIGEGDEAALAELLELLGPTLYPLTLGITQDRKQAAAAVEHAFAELWEKRAWLGRLPALSPWLVERCRAGAVALRSGIALSPAPSLQDRARDVPLTRRFLRCPPDVRVSRINSALDQIGAQEREALILAVRTGRSLSDISSQLGTSTDQMSALLRTGLRQLRQSLEETLRRETT
jgi:DNA-directed RNA polymerase specialized sigma24 family protein